MTYHAYYSELYVPRGINENNIKMHECQKLFVFHLFAEAAIKIVSCAPCYLSMFYPLVFLEEVLN